MKIDRDEWDKAVDKMNIDSTAGPDGINTKLISELKESLSPIMSLILDKVINEDDWPDTWNHMKGIMLKKPGKRKNDLNGYRIISL